MLFQLSEQNFPDAIHTSVIPEAYASIALPDHTVNATIDDCCTLIHQSIEENNYTIWVNNFFIHKPLVLYVLPEEPTYSLYYSMENTARFLIYDKVSVIAPEGFSILEMAPCYHYGIFTKGVYRSLHLTVDARNRSILQNQDYVTALLREHYYDIAF
ncbi:hypothetical protein GFS24_28130 [Chitinophaga sp. SYP-B3965]|uniref:hypothetical protein n=1 Tax=Chitinophaga sp. SYP-B3965 TaxID=2663120 RepID=UPI00129953BB|nr:hypothetical protein [Chitinophaga sp. SYP-B3965]MRG49010.1 hypothetical protein [Chitinophaga sp. SYP-B3965]